MASLRRKGAVVSGRLRIQTTALTTGADNAPGTHRPGHHFRGVCAARDRRRVEDDVAVAGSPAPASEPGGWRFAPSRAARDRTAGTVGRGGAALCAAQATAAVELRRIGVSSRGF